MATAEAPKNVHLIKDNKITKFSKNSEKKSILKHVFYEEPTIKKCCDFTLILKKFQCYLILPQNYLTKNIQQLLVTTKINNNMP